VSRQAARPGHINHYERAYDFAWLGVLSHMTYSNSDRGFALCSRRSNAVSRLYLQIRAVQCCELSLYYNSLRIRGPEWATGIPEAEKL
jgi:hypothetical protein